MNTAQAHSSELRLEWRSPTELADNPKNWRVHPNEQMRALNDVLREIGWAGVILFNEQTGRIIDGHARKKVALRRGHEKVPVLIGSWDEAAEAKILATLDPLAGMAEANKDRLEALLQEVRTGSPALIDLLEKTAKKADCEWAEEDWGEDGEDGAEEIPEQFNVLVECESEEQQAELLQRLTNEGLVCRSLIS